MKEIRMKDPKTGAEKGLKIQQASLIPPDFIQALLEVAPQSVVRCALPALATHYGKGAKKYARHNWTSGYAWSWSLDALYRHLFAWWGGEALIPTPPPDAEPDPTAGSPHLVAVMWHIVCLWIYTTHKLGTDDRFPLQSPRDFSTPESFGVLTARAHNEADVLWAINNWHATANPDVLLRAFVWTARLFEEWKANQEEGKNED